MSAADLDAYLRRIGLSARPTVDAAGLIVLHRAQAFSIPFENLDILLGRGVDLSPKALRAKLVDKRRGGYCFELNGLLQWALSALGFQSRPALARVLLRRSSMGVGPLTHQVNLIDLGGRTWVADAGFGAGSLRLPIPLESGPEHDQFGESFRLREDDELGWILQLCGSQGWHDLYAFRLDPVYPADIVMANHFTSTFPSSPFCRFPMLARPHEHGRITMSGDRIVHYGSGEPRIEQAPTGEELLAVLREGFHIELDAEGHELPGWPVP